MVNIAMLGEPLTAEQRTVAGCSLVCSTPARNFERATALALAWGNVSVVSHARNLPLNSRPRCRLIGKDV